ncbi:hypothetical protein [Gilvibacter sediminis]|uniref:hypothetical protein n=1 Tax=Gilvibacter sediminis TaxID=379071 RepID=UPI00235051CC|nr:hypothetical protein [Gilvibacter sediminis]MDC7998045.1 hypothetical protein [Gilvibacter sediminis]
MKTSFKVAKVVKGLPHLGEVILELETTEKAGLEIIEDYRGEGWIGQGSLEVVPKEGYESWKAGVRAGIQYAFGKLKNVAGLKVVVIEANGMTTDTNPTILAYAASRAILQQFEHKESEAKRQNLESLVYSSYNFDLRAIPDFDNERILEPENPAIKVTHFKASTPSLIFGFLISWAFATAVFSTQTVRLGVMTTAMTVLVYGYIWIIPLSLIFFRYTKPEHKLRALFGSKACLLIVVFLAVLVLAVVYHHRFSNDAVLTLFWVVATALWWSVALRLGKILKQ